MCFLCSALNTLPRLAFDIPNAAFSLISGVIKWALPRNLAALDIFARAAGVFAGFAVRFVCIIWQELLQKYLLRLDFGFPHTMQ
jgi:hypothetical protein